MIKSVELTNFKRHAKLQVSFEPGVNIICGSNYAGKSSILHAILFALWGVSAVPGGAASAWKRGTKSTKVVLTFVINGVEVEVTRTRTSAVIVEGGDEVSRGTSPVNNRIADLLGVSRADFNRSKYAEQKETAALLSDGPTILNELVERVSGADLIAEVLQRVKTVKSRKEGALETLTFVDTAPLEAEVKTAQAQLSKLVAKIAEAEAERIKRQGQFNTTSEALQEAIQLNKAVAELRERITILSELITTGETKLSDAEERLSTVASATVERKVEAQRAVTDLDSALEARRAALRGVEKVEADHVGLEQALQDLTDSKEEKQARIGTLKQNVGVWLPHNGCADLPAVNEALMQAKITRSALSTEYKTLETALGNSACPTCHRKYDEEYDIEKDKQRLTELNTALVAKDEELSTLADLGGKLTDNEISIKKLSDSIHLLETADIPRIEENLERAQEQFNDYKSILEELAKLDLSEATKKALVIARDTAIRELNDKLRLEGAIGPLKVELEERKAELESLPEPTEEADTSQYNTPLSQAQKELNKALQAKAEISNEMGQVEGQITVLEQRFENQQKINLTIKKLETELARAASLQKFLRSNREKFLTRVWDHMLASASALCSNVTSGAISALERDGSTFTYLEDGESMPIPSASGAQKSLMGLAMKVSLASCIQDSLNCLLLDEVTADMDEAHSLATTSLLGTLGPQIISVSHLDLDVGGSNNIIYVEA